MDLLVQFSATPGVLLAFYLFYYLSPMTLAILVSVLVVLLVIAFLLFPDTSKKLEA